MTERSQVEPFAPPPEDAAPTAQRESLQRLLQEAALAQVADRGAVVTRLIAGVEASTGSEAAFLEQQLDQGAFDGLRDPAGRDLKSVVIGKLVALGYPHALRISPEALAYWRRNDATQPQGTSPWGWWFAGSVVAAGAQYLGILDLETGSSRVALLVVVPMVIATVLGLLTWAESAWLRVPARVLLFCEGLAIALLGSVGVISNLPRHPLRALHFAPAVAMGVSLLAASVSRTRTGDDPD